jgi:hypothetical protein
MNSSTAASIELKPEDALQHAMGNGRTTSSLLPSNSQATKSRPDSTYPLWVLELG